jgi:hypothetical protein
VRLRPGPLLAKRHKKEPVPWFGDGFELRFAEGRCCDGLMKVPPSAHSLKEPSRRSDTRGRVLTINLISINSSDLINA